ncbi:MAG: sigma-70 family RNA polymerase sigma factor [Gemmataceae bacterium]
MRDESGEEESETSAVFLHPSSFLLPKNMADASVQTALVYHFCRLRLPTIPLPLAAFARRLEAAYQRSVALPRKAGPARQVTREAFLEGLHALDLFLSCACLEGFETGWEALFAARASRSDTLLVDALRARAARLYPRDPERQEEAVTDFWGYLLAGQRERSDPILARYDGQRPLVPWLLCVFQNKELSKMRRQRGEVPLAEDDLGEADLYLPEDSDARWHEQFREAAREWFAGLSDQEVLLLGLRLRYKLSQREVAKLLGIHEGNVTRRIDAVSKRCHERIGTALRELGWTGDDLYGFIRKEMYSVLLEEPRLAADRLASLLAQLRKDEG